MADSNMQLNWTDDQWNRVREVVYEEARKARVAGNFLPLYGPLEPDATYVSKDELRYEDAPESNKLRRILVNDKETQPLLTLEVLVYLRSAQVADPELTSAISAFRRAANVLARLEDTVIFYGKPDDGDLEEAYKKGMDMGGTPQTMAADQLSRLPPIWRVTGADETYGLAEVAADLIDKVSPRTAVGNPGGALVTDVVSAISQLEQDGYFGPFACVLGHKKFLVAQSADDGRLILPQDRILPFLGGGPLLRTSTLEDSAGLVIASGGAPIDFVVATDISVRFLQVTLEPRFVFRVYEKIALRVKQPAVVALA
jgi:uncharacterized linocin/CFP29 family protein